MIILGLLILLVLFYSITMIFFRKLSEKIIIINQMNSLITLAIALIASINTYNFYIDLAIIYSLFGFISVKILLYYQNRKQL